MFECIPLFVPSNLGETELRIGINPNFNESLIYASELNECHSGSDETYCFEGFSCLIWDRSMRTVQQKVNRFSKRLEKHSRHPIQSNRLYFLPLFTKVCYSLNVTPNAHHERPVIRVEYCHENLLQTWTCKIYTSNLVQLQEALLFHEQNLLKKRLQVLNKQRAEIWGR